jgi:predicted CoA-binding protein
LSQQQIREILNFKIIAVVGLSDKAEKDSYRVAAYLQQHGYLIIPINPTVSEVLGEKSYKSLLDVPPELQKTIEVVDIFRRSEDVPPIVDQAIQLKKANGKPYTIWMQIGIVNEQAAEKARRSGLTVVMDRCLMVEHQTIDLERIRKQLDNA